LNYLYDMVLVTGATGLVGSHLVLHLLENNESVRASYRSLSSIEKTKSLFALYGKEQLFEKIEWVAADITEVPSMAKAFAGIDHVYHCAAMISFDPSDEKQLRKINIEGTANVVNFCLDFHIKKLCYVSSIAALGDLKEHETIITEETEWNPELAHSDYAISKYGAEMEIWRGHQEGLQTVIINPGIIIGPVATSDDWKNGSASIFPRVAKGLRFYTKGSTGFISVHDVVKMLRQLMKSDRSGERFIAIAENMTFEKMLGIVAEALNVSPPKIPAKHWMTSIGWRSDWIISGLLNRPRKLTQLMARSLHQTSYFSNDNATMKLDFKFGDITTALRETAKKYLQVR